MAKELWMSKKNWNYWGTPIIGVGVVVFKGDMIFFKNEVKNLIKDNEKYHEGDKKFLKHFLKQL